MGEPPTSKDTDLGAKVEIVDDDPSPVNRWLPAFAQWLDAPSLPNVTEQSAREAAGEDTVYYGAIPCGATNGKARRAFGFKPRPLEWLNPA